MRNVTAESMAILKNKDAIAVSQDPLGQMGIRLTGDIPEQIWARELANGCAAPPGRRARRFVVLRLPSYAPSHSP